MSIADVEAERANRRMRERARRFAEAPKHLAAAAAKRARKNDRRAALAERQAARQMAIPPFVHGVGDYVTLEHDEDLAAYGPATMTVSE
jgi:hypothetical protein